MTDRDKTAIRAAYEQLEEAIQKVVEARYGSTDGMVLTGWVVSLVQQGIPDGEEDGGVTSFIRLYPPRQPWHHTIGILRGVTLELEHDFLQQEDT